jgi:hypothetical protein
MSKTSKTKKALTEEQLAKVAGGMRARGWHYGNSTVSRAERRLFPPGKTPPSYKAVQ